MKQLVLPRALRVGERERLTGRTHHYLVHVRRLGAGDELAAIDPDGARYAVRLVAANAVVVEVERLPGAEQAGDASSRLTVCPALLKGRTLDAVIRQLSEMGVDRIVPLITARCIPDHTGNARQDRWVSIAAAAVQQSGRKTIPRIDPPMPLSATGGLLSGAIVFHELGPVWRPHEPVPWSELGVAGPLSLFFGPEGGFAPEELSFCRSAGATVVGMPFPVLRAETAMVALSAIVLFARAHYTPATDHE